MAGVSDADFIIEAVFEEMEVKKQVFAALDRPRQTRRGPCHQHVLPRRRTPSPRRPTGLADVVGTHFFSPANVMRLLEIVRGAKTAPDVLATAVEIGRRIGKVPVVVGVCHGFVGNRMLSARSWETERLLLEGASPSEVDGALTDFGFPMGPFAMGDLAGLDVGWRMRKADKLTARRSPTRCARWAASARRPAAASTSTKRGAARRFPTRRSKR